MQQRKFDQNAEINPPVSSSLKKIAKSGSFAESASNDSNLLRCIHALQAYCKSRPLLWVVAVVVEIVLKIFFVEETLSIGVPLLRGKFHLLLLYLSPFWLISLFRPCTSKLSLLSAFITALSSLFNFAASATLHNHKWSTMKRKVIARIDYAGIFVMISGSCSPLPIMLCSRAICIAFMLTQWGIALIGISLSSCGKQIDSNGSLRTTIYIFMGLSNVIYFKHFFDRMTLYESVCVTIMGLLYIVGGIFYARKSPNLWPKVFGYHELFHFCCFCAGICTFMLNMSVLSRSEFYTSITAAT